MANPRTFYTYLWLREDGTPYYVGKGVGNRAFRKGSPPFDRILLQEYPDEAASLAAEKFLIEFYGRKDLGTGILNNLTDGAGGLSNPSPQTRERLKKSHAGQIPWHTGKHWSDEVKKKLSDFRSGKTFISAQTYKELGERFSGEGNPFFGRKHSPDTLRKLSAKLKGRSVWNKGVPVSEEHKRYLSAKLKGRPRGVKIGNATGSSELHT